MSSDETIYVVDDDPTVREALVNLLRSHGHSVKVFRSGREFLDFKRQDSCACLLLDLNMPSLNGLEVQALTNATSKIPVIFLTGLGDVPSSVKALKSGAIDFLTKPIDESELLASIRCALDDDRQFRQEARERENLLSLYRTLTRREREVLSLLTQGLLNKQAAGELGITEYTVQIHRAHIMKKMQADSFATLVKLGDRLRLES